MELRLSEIDGKRVIVVRNEMGSEYIVKNVEIGVELKNIAPKHWRLELSAFFTDD